MKSVLLIAALVAAPVVMAHPLDNEHAGPAVNVPTLPKGAPAMIVEHSNTKTGAKKVAVLAQPLKDGQDLRKLNYVAKAIAGDSVGIKLTALNDKELNTSTPAWGLGYLPPIVTQQSSSYYSRRSVAVVGGGLGGYPDYGYPGYGYGYGYGADAAYYASEVDVSYYRRTTIIDGDDQYDICYPPYGPLYDRGGYYGNDGYYGDGFAPGVQPLPY